MKDANRSDTLLLNASLAAENRKAAATAAAAGALSARSGGSGKGTGVAASARDNTQDVIDSDEDEDEDGYANTLGGRKGKLGPAGGAPGSSAKGQAPGQASSGAVLS
jgi:hypothetical protein